MDIGKRIDDMGKSAAALGAWATIASAGAIALSAGDAIDGEGYAISRVVLGIIGLAAAALFWSGRNYGQDGMLAILAWGVLQIPFYATAPGENYTRQLFDLFVGATSQTTVNGEIRDYSQVGINLVGVAVAGWAGASRKRLDLWRRRALSPTP
jgi:hypothetical protein